ncbi:MAG: efflux RND transporter periplasmic adaptor subunit [Bacteroidales bacterium]|jgi:RND family efflux transporter MFP subunit|nr:efflux RND transporter periplasmic adaptor subunit [Bacteroidales bacterium]
MKKILFISGLIFFLFSCGNHSTDKKVRLEQLKKEHDKLTIEIMQLEKELYPSGREETTTVNVSELKKQSFEHYIEVQGRIDGNENIGVSPRNLGGVVTKIRVHEGDYVTRGQVLAELDADVLKQQLKDLQSKLAFATDIFNRQKALWDQKIGSEVQYLQAKNNMESAQNGINTLQDQIKMSVITAPIDGAVEDIPIKVGQMASSASPTPAFRIVNFSKAKALADVGEAYSSKIQTGDAVKVFLPDFDQELEEKVTFASKYINPTNRTFLVEVDLPVNKITFRANMIAVLRIKDYANPSTIAIPQNYIQTSRDEGQYVFVAKVENGKKVARKRPVTPFVTFNGLTEIITGLNEGDKIITAGYKDLYDGQLIDF